MKIQVRVLPRSSKQEVIKSPEGNLRVYLRQSPVDGKANIALTKLLAEHMGIQKSRIRIVTGKSCRNKVIEII
jgi:uncharacterized protein